MLFSRLTLAKLRPVCLGAVLFGLLLGAMTDGVQAQATGVPLQDAVIDAVERKADAVEKDIVRTKAHAVEQGRGFIAGIKRSVRDFKWYVIGKGRRFAAKVQSVFASMKNRRQGLIAQRNERLVGKKPRRGKK
ncbi:MAG TPA: hypothetical protein PLP17_09670 [Oligoflexia bacterium]|nr:hypothetical protein [Oligoflexia bacterium]